MIWHITIGNSVSLTSWFAHSLLHTAWVREKASGQPVKPWPWANTWPIARISVPHLDIEQFILSQAGEGMSVFALGHSTNSVLPGEIGNSVLNIYHRDTFVGFLKKLRKGDELVLESLGSGRWHYQVLDIRIVDKRNTRWIAPCLKRRLTLIGCYSCNINEGSRYVVIAVAIERMA
ncbi:hypothetical protein PN36_12430 [Candidatus Thiomargarita nelsonii]|uniref:Sortase family protein n=1 Tax=Candidatus Thiomargarita nelsonii TaxID=1003181 RepID=A0A4E0RST0_9GAMM|nr:hypothetical protein PN36_12430 [Candidatus Thiomargarita nelsonii]